MGNQFYTEIKNKFFDLVNLKDGIKDKVIEIKTLAPEEAIGKPEATDYPLLRGKEVLIEGVFQNGTGQAFTNYPVSFKGKLETVLNMKMDKNAERAIFIATLNAVMNDLGLAGNTIHCRNEDVEKCGLRVAGEMKNAHGDIKVGIIGYQPSIIAGCLEVFGLDALKVTDMDLKNIGSSRFGLEIWDGTKKTEELISQSDVILVTGTTAVNNTAGSILSTASSKPLYFYGTTIAGIAKLMNYRRICPLSS